MQEKLNIETLPEHIQEMLQDKDCRKYLVFPEKGCFALGDVLSPDQKRILYGLPKEYSRLGTALVDAIWFSKPVKLLLVCGQKVCWSDGTVYKCHITGPLFAEHLQRIRSKDSGADMASSWEIRTCTWQTADAGAFEKELKMAMSELEGGSFIEETHLDLQLRSR